MGLSHSFRGYLWGPCFASSSVLGSGSSPENTATGAFCLRGGTPPAFGIQRVDFFIFYFMKPHLQLPFDGLLLVVSRCPLINHLKSLGGSPGPAPSGGWPDAFIATPAWVTVRKAEGKACCNQGGLLGVVSGPGPFASGRQTCLRSPVPRRSLKPHKAASGKPSSAGANTSRHWRNPCVGDGASACLRSRRGSGMEKRVPTWLVLPLHPRSGALARFLGPWSTNCGSQATCGFFAP